MSTKEGINMKQEEQTFARQMATELEVEEVVSTEELELVSGGCATGTPGTFDSIPSNCHTEW